MKLEKYNNGGEISSDAYFRVVTHFVYFCLNYPQSFLDAFSESSRKHLSGKFDYAYEKAGSYGAMIKFWTELDAENTKIFAIWIKNNYDKSYLLGNSNIDDETYLRVVTHFVKFCLNYPKNFLDVDAWMGSDTFKKHMEDKFNVAYEKGKTFGAMVYFWTELDAHNRRLFASWIKDNYIGNKLEEGGDIDEEEYDSEKDLFQKPELIPDDVKAVLSNWEEKWDEGDGYANCRNMQSELEELGYTFDYYLDAEPYNLRKKEMKQGGNVNASIHTKKDIGLMIVKDSEGKVLEKSQYVNVISEFIAKKVVENISVKVFIVEKDLTEKDITPEREMKEGGEVKEKEYQVGDLIFAKNMGSRGLVGLIVKAKYNDGDEDVYDVYYRGYRGDIIPTPASDFESIVDGHLSFAEENGDLMHYPNIAKKLNIELSHDYQGLVDGDNEDYKEGGVISEFKEGQIVDVWDEGDIVAFEAKIIDMSYLGDNRYPKYKNLIGVQYSHSSNKEYVNKKRIKPKHKETQNGAIGEPKFKKGDLVGYKSDSEFTKINKEKPAMRVVESSWNNEYSRWQYKLPNNLGYEFEHDLESREYKQGGDISKTEHYRFLEITKVPNGIKLEINQEGLEEVIELRVDEKSDDEILSELFDDVQGNSEYTFIQNGGDAGFGLTEAPMILDGYHHGDNGGYETDYPESAKVYYFGDYMVVSPLEVMLKDGHVIFTEAKETGGDLYKKGGKLYRTSKSADASRNAKPSGYRYKNISENNPNYYKRPTPPEILKFREGKLKHRIAFENRAERSDVNQSNHLEQGGSLGKKYKHVVNGALNVLEDYKKMIDKNNGGVDDVTLRTIGWKSINLMLRDALKDASEKNLGESVIEPLQKLEFITNELVMERGEIRTLDKNEIPAYIQIAKDFMVLPFSDDDTISSLSEIELKSIDEAVKERFGSPSIDGLPIQKKMIDAETKLINKMGLVKYLRKHHNAFIPREVYDKLPNEEKSNLHGQGYGYSKDGFVTTSSGASSLERIAKQQEQKKDFVEIKSLDGFKIIKDTKNARTAVLYHLVDNNGNVLYTDLTRDDLVSKLKKDSLELINKKIDANKITKEEIEDAKIFLNNIKDSIQNLPVYWIKKDGVVMLETKHMEGGGEVSIVDDLKNFDIDNLDEFESRQYDNYIKSMPKEEALQILINSVEGDFSQLSPELAELAEKQNIDWNVDYAKGGEIKNLTPIPTYSGETNDLGAPLDDSQMEKWIDENFDKVDDKRYFSDGMKRKHLGGLYYEHNKLGAYKFPPITFKEGGDINELPDKVYIYINEKSKLPEKAWFHKTDKGYKTIKYLSGKTYKKTFEEVKSELKKKKEFANGGDLNYKREIYVREIASMTGVSKIGVESFIGDNKLSDSEVSNIVIGLGRKLILPIDFSTAVLGEANNEYASKIISFARTNDANKKSDLNPNLVGKRVLVDFRKEEGIVKSYDGNRVVVDYPALGFEESLDYKEEKITILDDDDSVNFKQGGNLSKKTNLTIIECKSATPKSEKFYYSSDEAGLKSLLDHKNIEVLSVGHGKYDMILAWNKDKAKDSTLYFGKWNDGNFGRKYDGKIIYKQGGEFKTCPDAMEVTSLLFDKTHFNRTQAKAWAKKHNFKNNKSDITENNIRLRQEDPTTFSKDSFRTIEFGDGHGIKAIVACRK